MSDGTAPPRGPKPAKRLVDLDDLLDAHGAAKLLGLAHPNNVSVYQHRYADMPRPALDLGKGRVKLWLRQDLEQWATTHPHRPGRPRRES